jgi:hypothetical protein
MSIPINALVDYLYKKALGAPETNPSTALNAEEAYSSVPRIFQSQNYAQYIPKPAPNDWIPVGSNIQWSAEYPYIYKYTLLTLSAAVSGNDAAFRHPLMINIIPKSYDLTYAPIIYANNGTNNITAQPLILDPDSGILIFIPAYTAVVNTASPPKVTFYSYVGLIGNPGIASLQEL